MIWYLRVEGVNLKHFVYDTNDLSTIRGGGLLLLDAMEEIRKHFELDAISTGASSGLFTLKSVDAEGARDMRNRVTEHLNRDAKWQHATFVVDVLKEKDFKIAREGLLALNRWRQMRSPSLGVPSDLAATDACACDRLRPAVEPGRPARESGQKNEGRISRSVSVRRGYGVDNKRRAFYAERAGIDQQDLPYFVNDFDELTKNIDRGNLHHKMAVIYVDGNSFGGMQTTLCTDPDTQYKFDLQIKALRKELLHDLLHACCGKPSWTTKGKRHRMETLLWGGDEFIWVVPAWVGIWTLGFFYDRARSWSLLGNPVTHSAGLVFCHHNAPIHRITTLARNLCESAKVIGERSRNTVAYQVLESFDHAGVDVAAVTARRWPLGLDSKVQVLDGERLTEAWYLMSDIAPALPRRRIHRAATERFEIGESDDKSEDRVHRGLDANTWERLDALRATVNGGDASWIHLNELWDYLEG